MKIRQLEMHTRGHLSFVIARADDAAEGVGRISTYNADISATVFHRQVAPQPPAPRARNNAERTCVQGM